LFLAACAQPAQDRSAEKTEVSGWDAESYRQAYLSGDDYRALRLLNEGVAAGVPRARCIKAQIMFDGLYGPPDYAGIADLYAPLAFGDCQMRTVHLAIMYRDGLGVQRNPELARHHFRKMALLMFGEEDIEQSWPYARAKLPKNFDVWSELKEAYQWRALIRDRWTGARQFRLFNAFMTGRDVPIDSDMAFKVLEYSALANYAPAQYRMYQALRDGEMATGPGKQPLDFLIDAARGGHPEAQRDLGMALYRGEGFARDSVTAYGWLVLYSADGRSDADAVLTELERGFGEERTKEYRRRVELGILP